MDQASNFVRSNSSILSTVGFLIVIVVVLYFAYGYLYPGENATYSRLLKGEADARQIVHVKGKVPTIYTGGDFTLSFWVYIDDFNYLASRYKFVFALSPETVSPTTRSPLVGLLTPLQNGLMIRANAVQGVQQAPAAGVTTASESPATPDPTVEANLQALLNQQTSMAMFQTPMDQPCDVKEVAIQRWVNVTIASSGRLLDVYMDGKLTRSCMLEHPVHVPRGRLRLRLGESGGFGGRYSSVQMWSQQLTPDVIYGIYQMGPTQATHNIFTDLASALDLNVTFTGSAPGQPVQTQAPMNPFSSLSADASSAYSSLSADASSAYASGKSMMARF